MFKTHSPGLASNAVFYLLFQRGLCGPVKEFIIPNEEDMAVLFSLWKEAECMIFGELLLWLGKINP